MRIISVVQVLFSFEGQAVDEISVQENELAAEVAVDVEDGWIQVKALREPFDSQPIGLVPREFIKPADELYRAKVLYDFEASSDEELSVRTGQQVSVFYAPSNAEWTLVGTTNNAAEYGFVPSAYIRSLSKQEDDGVEWESAPNVGASKNVDKMFVDSFVVSSNEDPFLKYIEGTAQPRTLSTHELMALKNAYGAVLLEGKKRTAVLLAFSADGLFYLIIEATNIVFVTFECSKGIVESVDGMMLKLRHSKESFLFQVEKEGDVKKIQAHFQNNVDINQVYSTESNVESCEWLDQEKSSSNSRDISTSNLVNCSAEPTGIENLQQSSDLNSCEWIDEAFDDKLTFQQVADENSCEWEEPVEQYVKTVDACEPTNAHNFAPSNPFVKDLQMETLTSEKSEQINANSCEWDEQSDDVNFYSCEWNNSDNEDAVDKNKPLVDQLSYSQGAKVKKDEESGPAIQTSSLSTRKLPDIPIELPTKQSIIKDSNQMIASKLAAYKLKPVPVENATPKSTESKLGIEKVICSKISKASPKKEMQPIHKSVDCLPKDSKPISPLKKDSSYKSRPLPQLPLNPTYDSKVKSRLAFERPVTSSIANLSNLKAMSKPSPDSNIVQPSRLKPVPKSSVSSASQSNFQYPAINKQKEAISANSESKTIISDESREKLDTKLKSLLEVPPAIKDDLISSGAKISRLPFLAKSDSHIVHSIRTWTDRSGSFSTEAVYMGLEENRVALRKSNGVKITVPIDTLSLSDIDHLKTFEPSMSAYFPTSYNNFDWLKFLVASGIPSLAASNYAQGFVREKMDATCIPYVDRNMLKSFSIPEGDIIKIIKTCQMYTAHLNKTEQVEQGAYMQNMRALEIQSNLRQQQLAYQQQQNQRYQQHALESKYPVLKPSNPNDKYSAFKDLDPLYKRKY